MFGSKKNNIDYINSTIPPEIRVRTLMNGSYVVEKTEKGKVYGISKNDILWEKGSRAYGEFCPTNSIGTVKDILSKLGC